MRTLFVAITSYPPKGGSHLRIWQNINIMQQFGEVGVFSIFNEDLRVPEDLDVKLWHHYNMTAQSNLLDIAERGWRLLRRLGLRYYWAYSSRASKELEKTMREFQPEVVVLEELGTYVYLDLIKEFDCKIVFDNHNIEADLFQQIKCSKPTFTDRLRQQFHLPQIEVAEAELYRNSVQTWVCSEEDQDLMHYLYGQTASTFVIPNAIDIKAYEPVRKGTLPLPVGIDNELLNVLFLGNFFYPPNREAARILIQKVYPRLKDKFPSVRLLLVGSNPTAYMQEMAHKESDIIVTGMIPDVRPYLAAASVMLVPLKKGSGTRFKILESFASGCPVVSTTKGAEGLHVYDGTHLLIADKVGAMVEGIDRIYSDAALAEGMAANAFELVAAEYSWAAVTKQVEVAVNELIETIT